MLFRSHHFCLEDFSKFLLLTVFVSGLIMSQMEEPGYMLFVATIIGLQWQEKQIQVNHGIKLSNKKEISYLSGKQFIEGKDSGAR